MIALLIGSEIDPDGNGRLECWRWRALSTNAMLSLHNPLTLFLASSHWNLFLPSHQLGTRLGFSFLLFLFFLFSLHLFSSFLITFLHI